MAKLTKTEMYAIRWLDYDGFKSNQIAEELNLPENDIIKTIEKHSRTKKEETEEKVRTTKSSSAGRSQNLMIRETSAKKINSVSIMTGEASMMNDELMKKVSAYNPNTEKNIFRPNDPNNTKKKNGKK
jgi:orotate phosphoribosyltransferase-like protein